MKYEIQYTETNIGFFDVEAPDEDAAIDEFWRLVGTGEIDLLNTEIMESEATLSPYRPASVSWLYPA